MGRRMGIALACALLVASCGDSADGVGTSDRDVVIEALIVAPDGASGTFVASGPAVESGVVCAAGDWANVDFAFGAGDTNWFEDEMSCSDGSGSFVVRVSDLGIPTLEEPWTGPWAIIGGSGQYGDLQGSGEYSGDFSVEPGIERYAGKVSGG